MATRKSQLLKIPSKYIYSTIRKELYITIIIKMDWKEYETQ